MPSPARTAAFDILVLLERGRAQSTALLYSAPVERLGPADRALMTELVLGIERWRSWLDDRLAVHLKQPMARLDKEVATALRLGAYQLEFTDRIPPRAAIFESVELVKRARKTSAAPLVNAVLRRIQAEARASRSRPVLPRSPMNASILARELAHPLWIVERWVEEFGVDTAARICAYDQQPPPTAIRLRARGEKDSARIIASLEEEGVRLSPGRILRSAHRLESGDLGKTSALRRGELYIQDEASQLVAELVGEGTRLLDCCAAPGGKTAVMAEKNPSRPVVALELRPERARVLRRLVPNPNVEVVVGDARQMPLGAHFDRVLCDVPCSGTGTLARNPEIKWRLKRADLDDLTVRQQAILQAAAERLEPGGRLLYATCSLEPEENEEVIRQALEENSGLELVDSAAELHRLVEKGVLAWPDPRSLLRNGFVRTIPGIHPGDGFFAAYLEKE